MLDRKSKASFSNSLALVTAVSRSVDSENILNFLSVPDGLAITQPSSKNTLIPSMVS